MDWPLFISIISICTAAVAALVAYIAPLEAAKLAEILRKSNLENEEKLRRKEFIFQTLMKARAAPFTEPAVEAFNLIDVAFANCPSVRDSWARYFNALETSNAVPQTIQKQYFLQLLEAIAKDLGYASLTHADFYRIYSPKYVMQKLNVEVIQRDLAEADLIKFAQSLSANTTPGNS